MKVSVIIPALNEAGGIEETLRSIPGEYEIIVVDGCSTDGTQEAAKKAGAKVIIEPERGYGKAIKVGFNAASGDAFVTLDADGTYPAEAVSGLVPLLKDYDFITTNRFYKMEKGAMPFRNKLGNYILTFFTNALFGLKLRDSQSGMWIFKREVWEKIKNNVEADGMAFSEEIKIEAFKNAVCTEVGIEYKKRKGTVKLNAWKDGLGNLKHLFSKLSRIS
jgi:hypothetical protein